MVNRRGCTDHSTSRNWATRELAEEAQASIRASRPRDTREVRQCDGCKQWHLQTPISVTGSENVPEPRVETSSLLSQRVMNWLNS